MDNEVWKDIPGFNGRYGVSNTGRVRRIVRCSKHSAGYSVAALRGDGRYKHKYVHRLVAEAFIGPPPFPKAQVNHKNGDKADNRVENLEWSTNSENGRHAHRTGLNRGNRGRRWGVSKASYQRWLRNGEIDRAEYERMLIVRPYEGFGGRECHNWKCGFGKRIHFHL